MHTNPLIVGSLLGILAGLCSAFLFRFAIKKGEIAATLGTVTISFVLLCVQMLLVRFFQPALVVPFGVAAALVFLGGSVAFILLI